MIGDSTVSPTSWGTPWRKREDRYSGFVSEVTRVLTGEKWVAAVSKIDRPPTPDDFSITLDGRRLNSKEKVLEFLAEIEAERAAGVSVFDDQR
jgi:hypothetical protein